MTEEMPPGRVFGPGPMDAAVIRQSWQRHQDAAWHAAVSANLMFHRNNVLLLAGSDWNPEQNLQEEERLVVSFDDFRTGRITISDPALFSYLDKNPDGVFSLAPRQFMRRRWLRPRQRLRATVR